MLELPASMIGLVWNSMMSLAGGWFVLTLSEAFTLQNRDFRLPGIGSYMGEAINQFNRAVPATWIPIVGAVIAMVLMIVAVDQFFWRPIVAWSERFKMEETAESEKPRSWMLDLLHDSRIYQRLQSAWRLHAEARRAAGAKSPARAPALVYSGAGGWGCWRVQRRQCGKLTRRKSAAGPRPINHDFQLITRRSVIREIPHRFALAKTGLHLVVSRSVSHSVVRWLGDRIVVAG